MTLLVRTPSPFPTESLLGFVLRISETNGYETPWHMLRLAEIDQSQITTSGFPIERLASLLGKNGNSLLGIAYQSEGDFSNPRRFKILKHDLGQSMKAAPLRLKRPAFCPDCVEEDGYIDAFFDLNAAVACPRHQRTVLKCCPLCKKTLRWFRPGLLKCSCGADLSEAVPEIADSKVTELMGVIHAKLHGYDLSTLPNTTGFPIEQFDKLSLASFLYMLNRMGTKNSVLHSSKLTRSQLETNSAIETLERWPHGYHAFLTKIGNQFFEKNLSSAGLRTQFSSFYESMFKNRKYSLDIAFLRDELINFGSSIWGKSIIDTKLPSTPVSLEKRFISKAEYARRFNVCAPVMNRMINDGSVITQKIIVGKRVMQVVDVKLSQQPETSKGIITVREAAEILGLPVSSLEHIRDKGILKTKLRRGKTRSWHIEDIESFLTQMLFTASICVPSPSMITLKRVMRLKLRDSIAKGDIIAAIFDGRLPPLGRVTEKLDGLLLDKVQVDNFILQKRCVIEGNSYSMEQAAKLTGINSMAIAKAIEHGLLTSIEQKGRTRVSASAVQQFNLEYVPLALLAKKLGTLSQHLWTTCRKNNIDIIALPYTNGLVEQPVLARRFESRLLTIWKMNIDCRVSKEAAPYEKDCWLRYEASLNSYLDSLSKAGSTLPRRGGTPNKVAIAKACGFDRNVFYSQGAVALLLENFDKEEQTRVSGRPLKDIDALKAYLEKLRRATAPLPKCSNGRLNKQAIAKACGVNRKFFYNYPEAITLLHYYADGIDTPNMLMPILH